MKPQLAFETLWVHSQSAYRLRDVTMSFPPQRGSKTPLNLTRNAHEVGLDRISRRLREAGRHRSVVKTAQD